MFDSKNDIKNFFRAKTRRLVNLFFSWIDSILHKIKFISYHGNLKKKIGLREKRSCIELQNNPKNSKRTVKTTPTKAYGDQINWHINPKSLNRLNK